MADRDQVLREREIAIKAWSRALSRPDGLAAYLDREHPLPKPEPQQVTGPSGYSYHLYAPDERRAGTRWNLLGLGPAKTEVCAEDRATVSNLLCPFEDVVVAMYHARDIQVVGGADGEERLRDEMRRLLPAILARLSRG
jgi:hypothetical protein